MLEKELLHYLARDTTYIGEILTLNFKGEYLEFENKTPSALRVLYSILLDFYLSYRTIITGVMLQQYLKDRPTLGVPLKDILLLYEEVTALAPEHAFLFIIDSLKAAFAAQIMRNGLDIGTDYLTRNDITSAIEVIKSGLYSVEEIYQKFSDEGFLSDSVQARKNIYKDVKNKVVTPGLPTGYPSFDALTGGLKPGELDVILAGSGHGKSVYMLNVAAHVHMSLGKNVVIFSLELPRQQIERRYDSLLSGLMCNHIRDGKLSEEEELVYDATLLREELCPGKFYIVDQPAMTPQMIRAKLIELESKVKFDLVVVDYLGLIKPDKSMGSGWQDIGNSALSLREIAREFKLPFLTAMQINKEGVKNKKTQKHEMTDIAQAFAVIFHADSVVALKPANEEILSLGLGICELNASIVKCRDGNRGEYVLDAAFARIKILERQGCQ